MQVFVGSLLLTFFFCWYGVTCQNEEGYRCTRLVTEKPHCEVYNYRNPLCKKWDHSQCAPPRIIRDSSQCVSYKCIRKEPWRPLATPSATTEKTKPLIPRPSSQESHRQLEVSKKNPRDYTLSRQGASSSSSSSEADIESLRAEIEALRRVMH